MPSIVSNNLPLHKAIETLLATLQASGAWIHPELQINANEQGLSVYLPKQVNCKELIVLKSAHLIDVDLFEISITNGSFNYCKKQGSQLNYTQEHLLESMVNIYNESKRWDYFVAAVLEFNEQKAEAYRYFDFLLNKIVLQNTQADHVISEKPFLLQASQLSKTFLKTRTFQYQQTSINKNKTVFIPLLDCLNHHWDGAMFRQTLINDDAGLTVNAWQAKHSVECFVFYTPMDALDSYIAYHFVDENSPVVRSVPLTVNLEGLGCLDIKSHAVPMFGKKLNGILLGLNKHLPETYFDKESKSLQVSHLFIPSEHSPFSLRKILLSLLQTLKGEDISIKEALPYVVQIENEILEKNTGFYRAMQKKLSSVEAAQPDKFLSDITKSYSQEVSVAQHIIHLQLAKIQNYDRLRKNFKN